MLEFMSMRLLVLGVLFLPLFYINASDIAITKDRVATAKIVIAAKPTKSAQLAVKEFNHYLKKITGTELPVFSDAKPVVGNVVLIGESKFTKKLGLKNSEFKKQEYLIKTFPGKLVLMGHDGLEYGKIDYEGTGLWKGWGLDGWVTKPIGTVYAVHDFLRKNCGVRWYMPTDLGEVVPKNKTLLVKGNDIRRKPVTLYREHATWDRHLPKKLYVVTGEDLKKVERLGRDENLFYLRHKEGGSGFSAGHAFDGWKKRFEKTHPEYGAMQADGKRSFRELCYMSEGVQNQVIDDIRKRVKRNSNSFDRRYIVSITPGDGSEHWCKCEKCRKYFDPAHKKDREKVFSNGYTSKYIWTFVNMIAARVKKIDPKMIVSCLAYEDNYLPPEGIKFEDNVAVMLCRTNLTKYGPLFCDYGFKKKDMLKWKKLVKHLYSWEYCNFPQFNHLNKFPPVTPRRTAEAMKFFNKLGVKGYYYLRACRTNLWRYPATEHLLNYVAMRYNDDANIDIEKLLNEYYNLFYGPAAEPMRKFDEEMERIFVKDRKIFRTVQVGGANITKVNTEYCWTKMCPPGKLREFEKYFKEAAKLADREPYKSRVALMNKALLQFMKDSSQKALKALNIKVWSGSKYYQNRTGKIPALTNPAWDQTVPLKRFFDKTDGIVDDTEVNIINDNKNIYVMFKCRQGGNIISKNKKRDAYAWDDNFVEIFLAPQNGETYKHFIINPNGIVYDEKGKDKKWNSKIKTIQGKLSDGWYVIAQIPFKDISPKYNKKPKAHTVWRVNFCRARADKISTPEALSSWAPASGDFHNTKKFGKMVFCK